MQQAVNNSVDGDTILVNKGVYVENIDIDKKLTIISKSGNPEDTIVQALSSSDHIFHVTANNVIIKGFSLKNSSSGSGIYLDSVQYNTIANNHLQTNEIGIHLWHANNNILINNTASDNSWAGIRLSPDDSELASNNTLINNTMVNNKYNFEIYTGYENASMQNNIDTTNTVNGKPIYYFVNVSNVTLNSASNAGAIYCINCQNMSIIDQVLQNNSQAIFLLNTSSSRFDSNILSNNNVGIILVNSNNNSGLNNIAINNIVGIAIVESTDNHLSNNVANFNGNGFDVHESTNTELSNNTVNFNKDNGIALSSSTKSQLNGNTANYNGDGIKLFNCSNILLNNNITNSNRYAGIDLGSSRDNILTDNIANSNRKHGFELAGSDNNTLRGNIGNSDVDYLPDDSPNRTSKNETKDQGIENKSFIDSTVSVILSWIYPNNSPDNDSNNSISNFLDNISDDSINVYVHTGDSIQQVINNSSSGDIIAVDPGLYKENLVVDKSLIIISKPGEMTETIIQAADPEKDIFYVAADNVTISGFNVTGTNKSGIYYTGSDGILAGNELISDKYGIYLEKAENITIENNNASQNGCGIYLKDSSRNKLESNEVNYNWFKWGKYRNGVLLKNSNNNKLTDNNISRNWDGVRLENSSNNELSTNAIIDDYFCISLRDSNNNKLLDNTVKSIGYSFEITLVKSHNNTLQGNNAGFMAEIRVSSGPESTNNTLEGK
ncbi:nitrous oxide reductase family maturation protein NosD [Methanosarcina sp.]|uniref:right-handed parallel beta-helix repeat-containing protein n=1 Tax=Methanosarcina sp. TaxID=2213 RepID=UPI00298957E5|nr:NosD domain-containing protein [Methanosarcina sp.]MDW5552867.1 NosD domain-containing protein [Methanosarcina sp.]